MRRQLSRRARADDRFRKAGYMAWRSDSRRRRRSREIVQDSAEIQHSGNWEDEPLHAAITTQFVLQAEISRDQEVTSRIHRCRSVVCGMLLPTLNEILFRMSIPRCRSRAPSGLTGLSALTGAIGTAAHPFFQPSVQAPRASLYFRLLRTLLVCRDSSASPFAPSWIHRSRRNSICLFSDRCSR
jgi:hypothetical protein